MKTWMLLTLGLLVTGVLVALLRWWPATPGISPGIFSQGPTVERLERLADLVTTRVYVADVLTAEAEGHRGAWLIRGDGLLAVNLARATITAKDEEARQAVIRLPQPEVLQARVDHTRTRTWEVRKTTWVPWGGDQDKLRDSVMLHAQRLVAHAAGSPENLRLAKAAAEAMIRGFYEEFGWRVRILWEGDSPEPRPARRAVEPGSDALRRHEGMIADQRHVPVGKPLPLAFLPDIIASSKCTPVRRPRPRPVAGATASRKPRWLMGRSS